MTKDRISPRRSERRRAWRGALLGATALALVGAVPAGAGPSAHAASHSCSVPRYPGLGYFTSLSVSGTSCSTGGKVAVAYYRCRTHSGAKGRCHSSVLGYNCTEKRVSIPTEIDGRVTCRKGHATVNHTFQQNV